MSPPLDAYREHNRRTCAIFTPGGFRPTGDLAATRFGGIPLGAAAEPWPYHHDKGRDIPSAAVCQINLTGTPFVPPRLKPFAFITVFCALDPTGRGPSARVDLVTVKTIATRSTN